MDFWNYRLSNIWLDECLESLVSDQSSTMNMSERPKHLWSPSETDLRSLSLVDNGTLSSLYENIYCWSQVFSLLYLESTSTISNAFF